MWRGATAGLFSYSSWFLLNLLLALLFPVLALVRALGAATAVRAVLVACLSVYFLKILPFFGLYHVAREGDAGRLRDIRRGLVISNHTSWLDALIIIALVPGVRPVVSTRYSRVPLVSRAMTWLGCIFVDRNDRRRVATAVESVRHALRCGEPVAVFPEGTRFEIGHLGPFQEVFFSIAVEEKVVVEPLLLLFDIPFLGPGTENLLTQRSAKLTILKLDTITAEERERGSDLAFRTRRRMRKSLKRAVKEPLGA